MSRNKMQPIYDVYIYIYIYGGSPKLGVPFEGSHKEDYSIMGSILGSPYFWETTIICIYIYPLYNPYTKP